MSSAPATPRKRNPRLNINQLHEDNNNTNNKLCGRQQARKFIQWYKHMVDSQRQNLTMYLADDATMEWFGRTIKTRKKVAFFLKFNMHCSRHDFTTVESIDKIQTRQGSLQRNNDSVLASPLSSPDFVASGTKRRLRSNCSSPEWAEGCNPNEKFEEKQIKVDNDITDKPLNQTNCLKRQYPEEFSEMGNKGDGEGKGRRIKRKCVMETPPNFEIGQGDCMPSTSTDSNKSHDALNAQLPRLAVECDGFIEFTRVKSNRRVSDSMKWDRKCKVQISYSEDPLNVGEYIIWALRYADDSKCRRNLLSAFEEVANEEESKNA